MVTELVLAALVLGGAMSSSGGGDVAAAAHSPVASGQATGHFVDGSFTSAAGTRRWRLWIPSGYNASRTHALVVMLHGCTQDPDDLARGTRVTEHADRGNFLVLLPEQPESANPKKCWNWYEPTHQRRDAGEPSLIAGMTRQAMGEWSVDPRRIYVAGISAGAAMASAVVVAYPELYAAVALHSGIPYRAAANVMEGLTAMANGSPDTKRLAQLARDEMGTRARPIPAIIIQGASDPVVRPINAEHTRALWLELNAVAGDSASVESILVPGLGHAWSGGSPQGTFTDVRGPDATAEIVRFFLAHPMPLAVPNAGRP